MKGRRNFGLLALLGVLVLLAATLAQKSGPGAPSAQRVSTSAEVQAPSFVWERKKDYLGGGYALSPVENRLVYIGDEDGLFIKDLPDGAARLLVRDIGTLDVFDDPVFSPDGSEVAFSASGGTLAYPSDIYVMRADGSRLRKLTTSSEPAAPRETERPANTYYDRYFHSPQFSPDGKKILCHVYDGLAGKDFVAVMERDGSSMSLVSEGQPLFWSLDGESVYYGAAGKLVRHHLATRQQAVFQIEGEILARAPDREELLAVRGDLAYLQDLDKVERKKPFLLPLTKSPTSPPGDAASPRKFPSGKGLSLRSVQWPRKDALLLLYSDSLLERLEIVRLTR